VQQESEQTQEDTAMEPTVQGTTAESTRRIAVAAVLGAVSIALASTATFIPRIPGWGIALFDPVSLIWIIAFLLGGIEVGMVTTYAGFFGLFLFDPTGIGPVFKFLATVPMILIPWLAIKFTNVTEGGKHLANPRTYAKYMILAYLVRLALMIPLNLWLLAALFGIQDYGFVITYTLVLNTLQSFWDASIPFYIVFKTRLFEDFRMW
jgi:hypothetical protein